MLAGDARQHHKSIYSTANATTFHDTAHSSSNEFAFVHANAPGKFLTILFFLLPPPVIYTYLVIFPVIQAIYYSFFKWSGLGPLTDFIGLDNYTSHFMTASFYQSFAHNWLIAFLSVVRAASARAGRLHSSSGAACEGADFFA